MTKCGNVVICIASSSPESAFLRDGNCTLGVMHISSQYYATEEDGKDKDAGVSASCQLTQATQLARMASLTNSDEICDIADQRSVNMQKSRTRVPQMTCCVVVVVQAGGTVHKSPPPFLLLT